MLRATLIAIVGRALLPVLIGHDGQECPSYYASADIKCKPIRYGNPDLKSVPLPCLGAGFKFTDWDGDGLIDLLWLSHPRYNDMGAAAFHLETADLDSAGRAELIGSTYFGSLAFFQLCSRTGTPARQPDRRARVPVLPKAQSLVNGWKSNGRLAMEATPTTPLGGKKLVYPHRALPDVVDWNNDGRLDILMGGDWRRMSGVMVSMPADDRGHYFVYDGKSLPVVGRALLPVTGETTGKSARSTKNTLSKNRPNVLFIAVDDLNDWLGVLKGHPQARTPNFDRLAERGMLFTRAYCTAPACNPSRKSVLTGMRPSTSGLYYSGKRIRDVLPDVVTLPEHFKKNGYRVEGGGKVFHTGMNDPQSWHAYFKQPKDPEPRQRPHIGLGLHQFWRWQPLEHYDDRDMADGKLVAWARAFLQRKYSQPFFLGVGFYRPHMPWHVPKKYFDLFPLDSIELPATKPGDVNDLPGYGLWLARERTGFHDAAVKQRQWKLAVQAYLACIAFADAQLAKLIDALDASPHAENTIIVLWSDNGMHLGEKEHWTKWGLWEQATRVPLIVVAPGVTKPNSRCETPVSLLDLYPTLVDLCDLPHVERLEGESLQPLLQDPHARRVTPAITTHGHMNHAVRTARWRYIRYRDGSEELYDHKKDPREWYNLAGNVEYAESIRDLRRFLPAVNIPDPPYRDRKQYWPVDPSPDDVSDYPAIKNNK